MREIKFRAWHKILNLFLGVDASWYHYGPGIVDGVLSSDNCDIEQYTGLKDANGREIYEGDILKTELDTGYNWQVIDEKGGWVGRNYNLPPERGCIGLVGRYHLGKIEVIGNIHESPDLLK